MANRQYKGSLRSPGGRPQNVELVVERVPQLTKAEQNAGIQWVDDRYEPGNVLRYGADATGATDSTAAFDSCHSVLLQAPGRFVVPDGTYLIKSFDWTADDCFIQCDGILKHANTSAGYLMKIGGTTAVFNLRGYLKFDSDTTGTALASTISAMVIAGLVNSQLFVDIEGFTYNMDIEATGAVAYNKFMLGDMRNSDRGVYIRPVTTGYCNSNQFFGGRFSIGSATAFDSQWSIYIEDSGSNVPNDNQFFSPALEGKSGAFYDEGFNNNVRSCRFEPTVTGTAGTDFADPFIDLNGSGHTVFSASYVSQLNTITKDLGASTRVDDYQFTVDATGDFTAYAYPGARIYVTVSGTVESCIVKFSSHVSGVTTITVAQPLITASPTVTSVPLINVISTCEADFFFANDDVTGVSDAQYSQTSRWIEYRRRTGLYLESFSDEVPALTLIPSGSDANDVFRVADLSRTQTASMDGNGNLVVTSALADGLHLTDGVGTPGTTSGVAKLFVDTSDGDLKVKFGDGTVKTIVVDT